MSKLSEVHIKNSFEYLSFLVEKLITKIEELEMIKDV